MEGGGTLSEIYSSSKRLLLRTRGGLERLERLESSSTTSSMDSPELSFPSRKIFPRSNPSALRWIDYGDPSPQNPNAISGKVEQVAEEAESLKESLDNYLARNQRKMMEVKERAELLGRANGESSHILRIFDEESQALQSARNSSKMLEEAYSTGVAILTKYSEQRDHLKRAQRKALDILNTVGLSNTVLKLIERRHRGDKWIKYIGMAVTTIVVILFWRWTR